MKKDPTGTVRGILVVLMGLTAVFTLLGGVGTVCVAWYAENWKPFAVLADYKHVYQIATVITLAAGLGGFVTTFALLRGEKWAWTGSVITLLVGLGTAATKMYYSNMLRGSTSPTNFRCYVTVLALLVFLIVRMPGIWKKIDLSKAPERFGSWGTPTGITLFVGGLIAITTPWWAAAIHVVDGFNLVNVIRTELIIGGSLAMAAGAGILAALAGGVRVEQWALGLVGRLRTVRKPAEALEGKEAGKS